MKLIKSLIIIGLLSILAFKAFAAPNATDSIKTADNVKVTATQVYNDAKSVLKSLGDALKVGSEHVYEVLVKQQVVQSITNLVIGLLLAITLPLACKLIINAKWNEYGLEDNSILSFTLGCIFGILSLIVTIYSLINLVETVTGFVNPEYGAIKQILDLIKH